MPVAGLNGFWVIVLPRISSPDSEGSRVPLGVGSGEIMSVASVAGCMVILGTLWEWPLARGERAWAVLDASTFGCTQDAATSSVFKVSALLVDSSCFKDLSNTPCDPFDPPFWLDF